MVAGDWADLAAFRDLGSMPKEKHGKQTGVEIHGDTKYSIT